MANRIRFTTARQVVEAFPAAEDDIGEVPEDVAPLDFLSQLAADENPIPALFFAGLALPKREAVWWACLVMRGMGLTEGEAGAGLQAAEAWVRKPEEDERRAAGQFAEEVYFRGAGRLGRFLRLHDVRVAGACGTAVGSATPGTVRQERRDLASLPRPIARIRWTGWRISRQPSNARGNSPWATTAPRPGATTRRASSGSSPLPRNDAGTRVR